jgi:type 1 glutamine amidotransferase
MQRKTTRISKQTSSKKDALYTMEVFIIGGPVSEKFIERNPVISRSIEIQGDQTLEDFHQAIFDAFEREEEHMYEFQIGGKWPNDPKAKRYVLAEEFERHLWVKS